MMAGTGASAAPGKESTVPYRIRKKDTGPQDALRRIACEQIDRALAELDDPGLDTAARVHQVRKRCKKTRGLLRLVRPAFADYAAENAALRDIGRGLSGLRDAGTLVETCDRVAAELDPVSVADYAPIRARLVLDAKRVAWDDQTADRLQSARAALTFLRGRAAGWTLDDDGFRPLRKGMARTYDRARRTMDAAWRTPTEETLHDWRKWVKYHRSHCRLLAPTHPEMMGPRLDALDRLSDLLGRHHDACVLEERLEQANDFGSDTDVAGFAALVRAHRMTLEEEAFALGRLILAEETKPLAKRLRRYWKAWRKGRSNDTGLLPGA